MDTLSYKTVSANKNTVQKEWLLIDAENQIVGRLASIVAKLLRGKHKPYFTPHVDCGDYVIITNAKNIKLTGNKWSEKKYITYSGYPGGQKSKTARQVMHKNPVKIMEYAVKGMLPKNRLGKKIFNNLYVYPDSEHKHMAQKPKKYTLKKLI